VKVKNETNGNVHQLHVAEELGLVDGQNLLHRLEFQQEAILNQNIESQGFVKHQPFVFDPYQALIHRPDLAQAHLVHQAPLVDAFEETRPFNPMNLNGRANGGVAQLIGLLVKRMHRKILQKQTKETKKNSPGCVVLSHVLQTNSRGNSIRSPAHAMRTSGPILFAREGVCAQIAPRNAGPTGY
jgi:hypothetical protein